MWAAVAKRAHVVDEANSYLASPNMPSSAAVQQALRAYFYVGVWMTVSIGVILFNKWLLAFAGFPFPITLTLWHMIFCSAAGFICIRVLKVSKSFNLSVEDYVTRVLPIGAPPPDQLVFKMRAQSNSEEVKIGPFAMSCPARNTFSDQLDSLISHGGGKRSRP